MRVHGHMQKFKFRDLTPKDMETLVYEVMEEDWRAKFLTNMDFDFAYEIQGLARFRVNVFWQRKGLASVMRTIPTKVLTADQLGLSEAIRRFGMLTRVWCW
jgi:twitching motility protein PilT